MLFASPSLLALLPLALLWSAPSGVAAAFRQQLVPQGRSLYETHCVACHSTGRDRLVGPGLRDVTERRDRAWLIAFITNPDRLIAEGDAIAAGLLEEYGVPMPNLGLSRAEAESILAYLDEAEDEEVTPRPQRRLPAGDAVEGRELFRGRRRFRNGGAACISCHSVAGLGSLGGGTLAKDLTPAAASYGGGLAAVLEAPPFPVMQAVYAAHPLTPGEVADVVAFLAGLEEGEPAADSRFPFPVAGFGATVVLIALAAVLWRGRLRGVRKPLIGERQ
jgi:mono/diheme cytochrome c family protein